MKKLLLLLFILCLQFIPAKAQWVTIPDPNFVNKLTLLYPSCMNGNQLDTTCTQIINEDSLTVNYVPIADLTGIQYFDNLQYFRCYSLYIDTLPSLPSTLKYLNCSHNAIANLPNLPASLKYLDCSTNALTSLPTLPNTLEKLFCDLNGLTALPQLPSTLQELVSSNNQINNLPTLPNSLVKLVCNYCSLDNLPALPNLLDSLICVGNQLTSLPSLPSTLKTLDCGANQITTLPTLPNSIRVLSCYSNQILSIPSPMPDSLRVLTCGGLNQFTTLPQLPNFLQDLNCNSSNINLLPTLPNSLLTLYCDNINVTSLPTLPPFLQTLYCSNNQITSLPALPNTLQSLYCTQSQLTSLPPLPNSLKTIYCYTNPLGSLPTLPNALEVLICPNIQITSLPTLPMTLTALDCSNNQLTSIPPVPSSMNQFRVHYNNISCFEHLPLVTGASNYGNISNNPLTCVPNQTSYSLGLPLCLDNDTINNPNNCTSLVNISGYSYSDQDNNCSYTAGDLGSANIPVKLFDSLDNLISQYYTSGGTYGFALNQAGTYKVKIQTNNLPIAMDCSQPDSLMVNLISTANASTNNNFPIHCNQGFDTYVQSVNNQGWVFPVQVHTLFTNVSSNESWYHVDCDTLNYSGTVTIQLTGPVSYVSPAFGALTPQVTGNTFVYNISDFNSLTPTSFGLQLIIDTTALAGSQICSHISINTTPLDADTSNNVYNFCYNVVNSYDPNMKEVYPIDVLPGFDDWFTYTIHFQNTGTAPAFNIQLKDTLSALLDLNTFEVRGYSHPAITTLNGNILKVKFNNIMLPDSTTDYEGSMGYFQYRLKPLPNLPNGTQIENTAYIYFDYNAPIVTNTTENNFDITVGKLDPIASKNEFILFPNPSNGIFNFKDTKNLKQVEVYNLLGERILSQGNQKQINLSGLAKGIYYARINREVVVKLMKE
jgi:uncharacterized repeat protein (TIGR01451 family)